MTNYLASWKARDGGGRKHFGITAAVVAVFYVTSVFAQAPVAPSSASVAQSAASLDNLVGRIALYPDDLVAVILPASTFPLQIVQADRFLDKRKADPKLKYDEGWDDAVKTLLNYPEIVKSMSADLDWTSELGEAVVADQGEVLAAIQTFRRKTQAAGNLKSDDKQVVVVEKEVIKIVPADPQVIYVPQYNPTTVVVSGGYAPYPYYPPYPSYYYPYPPGAALATGIIFGAAIGAAWNGNNYGWNNGGGNNNININNSKNISTGNINRGNSAGNTSQWKSNKQAGQVSSSVGKTASNRGAGYGSGGSAGGARASQGGASSGTMGGRGTGAGSSAASQNLSGMGSAGSANRSAGGGNSSFGGYGSGRQTGMDSSRGASSRGSMSGGGGRSMGGGGGRSMGGGGGRGGGGRR